MIIYNVIILIMIYNVIIIYNIDSLRCYQDFTNMLRTYGQDITKKLLLNCYLDATKMLLWHSLYATKAPVEVKGWGGGENDRK